LRRRYEHASMPSLSSNLTTVRRAGERRSIGNCDTFAH
jgi:hypothetical protein